MTVIFIEMFKTHRFATVLIIRELTLNDSGSMIHEFICIVNTFH